ncbi:hypothetical protein MRX96_019318 [Rhipicephalus microplus]
MGDSSQSIPHADVPQDQGTLSSALAAAGITGQANDSADLVKALRRRKHLVDQHSCGLSDNKKAATECIWTDCSNTELATEPIDLEPSSGALMQVLALATCDVSCQTECSPVGELSILLSATDGATASTQVTHAQLLDKVCSSLTTELEACEGWG